MVRPTCEIQEETVKTIALGILCLIVGVFTGLKLHKELDPRQNVTITIIPMDVKADDQRVVICWRSNLTGFASCGTAPVGLSDGTEWVRRMDKYNPELHHWYEKVEKNQ